jgi:hypothetical protein
LGWQKLVQISIGFLKLIGFRRWFIDWTISSARMSLARVEEYRPHIPQEKAIALTRRKKKRSHL